MRLLFVEHHPVFGGPHNRAIALAAPLAASGWETIALLPDDPGTAAGRYRAAGIEVITIPLSRVRRTVRQNAVLLARFPLDVRRIVRLLVEREIDTVVVAGLESPHAAVAGRIAGLPVVWQINGTQTPPAYRRLMLPVAHVLADVVMTTGATIAAEFPGIERFGERWVPFLSPVDVDRFRPDPGLRAEARTRLGLSPDDVVVGMVANLNPQKGHHTFLEAAAHLRRVAPAVKFVLLGATDHNHAPFLRELWQAAGRIGIERDRDVIVRDPGFDVLSFEPAFDIVWMTSVPRSEGVPTALIEALALGVPAVATAVGGVRDIVIDGVNGFVVPPLDPEAVAEATLALIADPDRRKAMGSAARRVAVERCRIDICAATHVRALDIARGHARARGRGRRRAATIGLDRP